jgi:hypothetical protein
MTIKDAHALQPTEPLKDRYGYAPAPAPIIENLSVCLRCGSVVPRFYQEHHDVWHEAAQLHGSHHEHPPSVPVLLA